MPSNGPAYERSAAMSAAISFCLASMMSSSSPRRNKDSGRQADDAPHVTVVQELLLRLNERRLLFPDAAIQCGTSELRHATMRSFT